MSTKRKTSGGRPGGALRVPTTPEPVAASVRRVEDHDAVMAVPRVATFPDWVPLRLRQNPERGSALQRVAADAEVLGEIQVRMAADVLEARRLGVSWQLLGLALGLSAEGVRARYGRT
jgi:hypothetical protein